MHRNDLPTSSTLFSFRKSRYDVLSILLLAIGFAVSGCCVRKRTAIWTSCALAQMILTGSHAVTGDASCNALNFTAGSSTFSLFSQKWIKDEKMVELHCVVLYRIVLYRMVCGIKVQPTPASASTEELHRSSRWRSLGTGAMKRNGTTHAHTT